MAQKSLSTEWAREQAMRDSKDSDESMPEASTSDHLSRFSERAAGGADHKAGEDEGEEASAEASRVQGLTTPPDPPRGSKHE